MIGRVIAKDLRTLWWLGPALAFAAPLYAYSFYVRFQHPVGGVHTLLIVLLPYLVAILALARVVQVDSPAIRLGDWHTRPINPWGVLCAKAVIGLVGIVLPWGLVDLLVGLIWGLPLADCLGASGAHMLAMSGGLVLVIALAAVSRSLFQFVLAGFVLIAIALFIRAYPLMALIAPLDRSWPNFASLMGAGIGWSMALGMVAALLACLILLYRRRRVAAARVLLVAATLGVQVLGLAAAEANGRIWRPVRGPEPAIAAGVTVAYDPDQPMLPTSSHRRGALRAPQAILPLKIQAPDGLMLASDRTMIIQTRTDGSKLHWAWPTGTLGRQTLEFGYENFPELGPASLEVRMRLSLRRITGFKPLPIDGRSHTIGGLGVCRAWRDKAPQRLDRAVLLRCLARIRQPGAVLLWNTRNTLGLGIIPQVLPAPFVAYAETGSSIADQAEPLQAGIYQRLGVIERDFTTPVISLRDLVGVNAPPVSTNPAWLKDILMQRPPNMPLPKGLGGPRPSLPVNAK